MRTDLGFQVNIRILNARVDFFKKHKKQIETSLENINNCISDLEHNLNILKTPLGNGIFFTTYGNLKKLPALSKEKLTNDKSIFKFDLDIIEMKQLDMLNNPIEVIIKTVNDYKENWKAIEKTFEKELLTTTSILADLEKNIITLTNKIHDLNSLPKLEMEKNQQSNLVDKTVQESKKTPETAIETKKETGNTKKNEGLKVHVGIFAKELGFKKEDGTSKEKIKLIKEKLEEVNIYTSDDSIRATLNNKLGFKKSGGKSYIN